MKYFVIFLVLILTITIIPSFTNNVYAQCMAENEIDWNVALDESELVFVGGVININHVPNTQQIDFEIFEVIKGNIPLGEGYLYKNLDVSKSGNYYLSSSISVEYEISKIYKVYVHNGHTNIGTTKIVGEMTAFEDTESTLSSIKSNSMEGSPIPEPYYDSPIYDPPCGLGTTYQDGICIVDETIVKPVEPSYNWGGYGVEVQPFWIVM